MVTVNWAVFNIGFKYPDAALNFGLALVAVHHLGGRRIRIGHQQQFAVEQLQIVLLVLVRRCVSHPATSNYQSQLTLNSTKNIRNKTPIPSKQTKFIYVKIKY